MEDSSLTSDVSTSHSDDRKQNLSIACVVAASVLMAVGFLLYRRIYPSFVPNSDAIGYQIYAFRFREFGLFYDFGTVRTYGYPLFLYVLTFVSGFNPSRLALIAGIVQYALFAGGTLWLSALVARSSPRLAWAVRLGFLLNPLAISLVTDALTEGLTIPIFVGTAAFALWFDLAVTRRVALAAIAAGCFLICAGLIIRPANIALAMAWYLSACITIGLVWTSHERRLRLFSYFLLSTSAATIIVLGPQIAYNWHFHHKPTFFPVCNLSDLQRDLGIILWKYDTKISNGAAGPWFYLNPFYSGDQGGGWGWFIRHPLPGLATLFAHLFSAFSVTTPFTYVRDFSAPYSAPLRVLSWSLNIAGLLCALLYIVDLLRVGGKVLISEYPLSLSFVTLTLLTIAGLNAATAVEVRFNVIPMLILAAAAALLVLDLIGGRRRFSWLGAVIFAAVVTACVAGTYRMDRLASEDMGNRLGAFDWPAARCSVSNDQKVTADQLAEEYRAIVERH